MPTAPTSGQSLWHTWLMHCVDGWFWPVRAQLQVCVWISFGNSCCCRLAWQCRKFWQTHSTPASRWVLIHLYGFKWCSKRDSASVMCHMHSETEIYECIWVYTILLFRVPPGGIGYARTWSLLPSPSWCQLSLCWLCHRCQEGSGWYVGLTSESVGVCSVCLLVQFR